MAAPGQHPQQPAKPLATRKRKPIAIINPDTMKLVSANLNFQLIPIIANNHKML